MLPFLCHPLVPMVLYALFLTTALCTYLLAGFNASSSFMELATLTVALLLVHWVDADARHRKRIPCFDLGMFVFQFFPFSLLWYCWWSRRWHGLLMLGLLFGLMVIPYVVAFMVWGFLYGGRS